ncbi:hypothetical protein D9M68_851820 [compost metagenome]
MAAAVDQQLHLAVFVTRGDDRKTAQLDALEIAEFGNLALMQGEQPGAMEDTFHLVLENLLIGKDGAMHAVFFDQRAIVTTGCNQRCHCYGLIIYCLSRRQCGVGSSGCAA